VDHSKHRRATDGAENYSYYIIYRAEKTSVTVHNCHSKNNKQQLNLKLRHFRTDHPIALYI